MPIDYDPEQIEVQYLNEFMMLQDQRILEIGCGEGRLMRRYAHLSHFASGIDLDFERLQNGLVEQAGFPDVPMAVLNADGSALPFPSQYFQQVILGWSL